MQSQFRFTLTRSSWRSIGRLAVLALLALTGCRHSSGWVMNNSGAGYYAKGNYAMARHEFARAIQANPHNPDYRHNLAMAMRLQGESAEAEEVLRHNLTIDPMHQQTYHSLAVLLTESGRQPEAVDLLQSWVDTQPYLPEAHIEMAWMDRQLGNPAGAEEHLQQALQIRRNHPIALAHMGQLRQDQGQDQQAIAYYEESLKVNRRQPQVESRLTSLAGDPRQRHMASRRRSQEAFPGSPLAHDPQLAMSLETPHANPRPRDIRRHRNSDAVQTAYALPTYGSPYAETTMAGHLPVTTAYAPGGMITMDPGAMAMQGQIVNGQMISGPVMTSGPVPQGQYPMTTTVAPTPDPVAGAAAGPQVVLQPPQFVSQPQPSVSQQSTPWTPTAPSPVAIPAPTLSFAPEEAAYAPPGMSVPSASGPSLGANPDPAHTEMELDTVELPEINPF